MARDSVDLVTFTVQDGWTRTVHPDGTVYSSPVSGNGERCQLTVFRMRPAHADLLAAALAIFREVFRTEPLTGNPMPDPKLFRGASPLGWEYVIVRRPLGGQIGDNGSLIGAILLVARVGADLGVVAATSKDPPVDMFGDMVGRSWPVFFHSLRFLRARSRALDTVWRQRLAGVWTAGTGVVADRYVFAPNGRYAGAAAAQPRGWWPSNIDLMVTTEPHFGDGAYAIEGNAITFTPDDGSDRTGRFFRLEQESRDRGRTWSDRLCLLTEGEGEICYERERLA